MESTENKNLFLERRGGRRVVTGVHRDIPLIDTAVFLINSKRAHLKLNARFQSCDTFCISHTEQYVVILRRGLNNRHGSKFNRPCFASTSDVVSLCSCPSVLHVTRAWGDTWKEKNNRIYQEKYDFPALYASHLRCRRLLMHVVHCDAFWEVLKISTPALLHDSTVLF